jgi:hypothetical protein
MHMLQQLILLVVIAETQAQLPKSADVYEKTAAMPSPLANQAAAADDKYVYVVDNGVIGKYDRATGKELGRSVGKAQHLNSGFLDGGKLYAAHSNYPKMPHQSDIRVLDPETMKLDVFHVFEDPPGSLTWAVKRGDEWWAQFAHYGAANAKSVLVRYTTDWKETGRWTFPKELIADWGQYSLSGGIWHDGDLLTTGHDKKVIYRLKVPKAADGVVEVVDVIDTPFPGQGIASDPKTGGLVGIDRDRRQVVFATRKR